MLLYGTTLIGVPSLSHVRLLHDVQRNLAKEGVWNVQRGFLAAELHQFLKLPHLRLFGLCCFFHAALQALAVLSDGFSPSRLAKLSLLVPFELLGSIYVRGKLFFVLFFPLP